MAKTTAAPPSTRPVIATTSQDTDQMLAAKASTRVRLRPGMKRRATSWPSTMTTVLAAKDHPSRLAGTPPGSVTYAANPASIWE